ncbi:hypothetical protein [Bradyrhizobium japonicum]|uniref:hypothetical protein n=1 Tax=Bradyrhizobium japonicum TaxID=375 RepID=UPI00209EB52C|nr:hypothetical protein [Bradyrhizobium japonicum]MCP1783874.1 hypothetical protein [Bradyrhizobium japonicum]MCP1963838.1 hypothetical protein [Bradyrhizobium japonicum]
MLEKMRTIPSWTDYERQDGLFCPGSILKPLSPSGLYRLRIFSEGLEVWIIKVGIEIIWRPSGAALNDPLAIPMFRYRNVAVLAGVVPKTVAVEFVMLRSLCHIV